MLCIIKARVSICRIGYIYRCFPQHLSNVSRRLFERACSYLSQDTEYYLLTLCRQWQRVQNPHKGIGGWPQSQQPLLRRVCHCLRGDHKTIAGSLEIQEGEHRGLHRLKYNYPAAGTTTYMPTHPLHPITVIKRRSVPSSVFLSILALSSFSSSLKRVRATPGLLCRRGRAHGSPNQFAVSDDTSFGHINQELPRRCASPVCGWSPALRGHSGKCISTVRVSALLPG